MKATIELSDELSHSAKELASKSQTIMSALVDVSLRRVNNGVQSQTKLAFNLEDKSVRGGTMLILNPRAWHELNESSNPLV